MNETFEYRGDRSKVIIHAEVYIDREDKKARPKIEIFTSDIDNIAMSNLTLKIKKSKHIREIGQMFLNLADYIDSHNKKEVYV